MPYYPSENKTKLSKLGPTYEIFPAPKFHLTNYDVRLIRKISVPQYNPPPPHTHIHYYFTLIHSCGETT